MKENQSLKFWRLVVEYKVFYGYPIHQALASARQNKPGVEDDRSEAYAQRKLKSYELTLYKNQLYKAIQCKKELIKSTVEHG